MASQFPTERCLQRSSGSKKPSAEFPKTTTVPDALKQVGFMVKDSETISGLTRMGLRRIRDSGRVRSVQAYRKPARSAGPRAIHMRRRKRISFSRNTPRGEGVDMREPELLGQTCGCDRRRAQASASGRRRRARAEGAKVILTGRNPERLQRAARELEASSSAAFRAPRILLPWRSSSVTLLPAVDHVMVTAGRPSYGRLLDIELAQTGRALGNTY